MSPKKWLFEKIDNYILKYHASDFIRREMIQDEILKRINEAVAFNNKIRDEQERAKIDAEKLSFEIERDGLMASINQMERVVADTYKFRDELMAHAIRVEGRAKEVAMITAENKHEGNNIIKAVAASIGKLDVIGCKAEDVVKEITVNKPKDENALRIK